MVTSVTRQSVIIKCNMRSSVMTGNYEFYYAAGLFLKLRGMEAQEDMKPLELRERILPELKKAEGEEGGAGYLVKLLQGYKVSEDYDEDMKELLLLGLKEENPWQVVIP